MYFELLKQFFDENKPETRVPIAAAIMHFQIKAFIISDANSYRDAFDKLKEEVMPERLIEAAPRKAEIQKITAGAEIVRAVRRKQDPLNYDAIVDKAMEFEEEIVPDIIRRFKNNMTSEFIETATLVLGKSKMDMADEIMGYYDDMRSPYAQSMALVLLGFKADVCAIPWLILKHNEMKRRYPRDNYHYGAYYGLVEMAERFLE